MEQNVATGAIASDGLAVKLAAEGETPYANWVRAEGLDIIEGGCVADLRAVELKQWARRGGRGVFIHHEATPISSDCYVCEIPPGKSIAPQRHLYEETIFVLGGRGSTSVWDDAGESLTFEWKAGALFAVPINSLHQHFNGSGRDRARFVAVTTAPAIINAFRDFDSVFGAHQDFKDRLGSARETPVDPNVSQATQIDLACVLDDAVNSPLMAAPEGEAGGYARFRIAAGSMLSHISQLPPATYNKARAEGPGVHVIILAGEGYSLMWREGGEPVRYQWREGALMVPPGLCWRQHFNTGRAPARYLALIPEAAVIRNAQGMPKAWISRRLGGDQIDYADEAPEIRASFAAALAENGLEPRMREAYAAETA